MENAPDSFAAVLKTAHIKRISRGQILLYQGDAIADVYVLKTGNIKLHDIDDKGNEKILHIVKPPAIMPLAFFSGEPVHAKWFYTALVDSEVYVLPHTTLLAAMQTDSVLSLFLMHWFSNEVHELLVRLSSLGKSNSHDKVIAVLKFLAVCHAEERRGGWYKVSLPVSHQLLADLTGITRESAALVMKEFLDKGLVRNPRLTALEVNLPAIIGYQSE